MLSLTSCRHNRDNSTLFNIEPIEHLCTNFLSKTRLVGVNTFITGVMAPSSGLKEKKNLDCVDLKV